MNLPQRREAAKIQRRKAFIFFRAAQNFHA
jgi:hypothetical protein